MCGDFQGQQKLLISAKMQKNGSTIRRQGGGQKSTGQASGSVVRQHQGVVRAQLSKVNETSQSASDVASDFSSTLNSERHRKVK